MLRSLLPALPALPAAIGLVLAVSTLGRPMASPQASPAAIQTGARADSAPGRPDVPVIAVPERVRVGIASRGASRSYAVRTIPIEEYVAGVLVGEAARDSQPAVLEALAVAIRTYALRNLRRHEAEGFDVCDQTHCQVLRTATPITTEATADTAGQVLTWNGVLAIVYYSASCGGHSEIPSAVWPGAEDPPYLPARTDDGCGGTPQWAVSFRTMDIERALAVSGYRGSLDRLRILTRDGTGRVAQFAVDGLSPSTISGQDLRIAVGAQRLKSTALEMRRTHDGYEFSGRGYGHGVGMCVIGATRLAERGETARELLARYFPGTAIGVIDAPGVVPVRPDAVPVRGPVPTAAVPPAGRRSPPAAPPGPASAARAASPSRPDPARATAATVPAAAPAAGVAIPDAAARDRQELETLASRVRSDLAAQLQVAGPALIIRAHQTDVDYERATGRHWFTWGALVGDELHLMPLAQLRQQGLLERIVRRETVHRLIDEALVTRPRWVRDGLALYFSDPQRQESDQRAECPTDDELTRPVSAGALAQAYARARACVARQLASGRSWREVR